MSSIKRYEPKDHNLPGVFSSGEMMVCGNGDYVRHEDYAKELDDLRGIIKALTSNPHINLGDLTYTVRDKEGEGWDGPAVKAWSEAVTAAEKAISTPSAEGRGV